MSSITESYWPFSTSSVWDGSADVTVLTATEDWVCTINAKIYWSNSLSITYCYVSVNGNVVASGSNWPSWSGDANFTATFTVMKWDVVKVAWQRYNYWSWNVHDIYVTYTYATVSDNVIKAYPRDVYPIWQLWFATLYWKHNNGLYYWWLIVGKATSATTWSVTLWNAVWYLLMDLNWQIVKIPYYT